MSRVYPIQTSFNGGEISRRLRWRIDQSLYAIAVGEMVGFAPLVEGPAEAMPGTIHVAAAAGPCRLLAFEYSATQGHILEASAGRFRIYTNDALMTDANGAAIEVASPYNLAQVQALRTHQSYDVLYCFHPQMQPRTFARTGAAAFGFDLLELSDGPFEPMNADKGLIVSASHVAGNTTLTASAPLFTPTDVGSLFQIEAADFGDTPAWEPGITVTRGALRTSLERVYRAVSAGRTGGLQPAHTEGVEWDGMGTGQDVNSKPAPGVQWEFVHDKFGILRITQFTNAQSVQAVVLRRLPFSAVGGAAGTGNYGWQGGYYAEDFATYTAPEAAIGYAYGTWRWRFGAFSDTRGWPQAGCIWNERLCLAKDSTIYASVAGDLTNFAAINELGELSNDMAFTATIADPNPIRELTADEKLLAFTAGGCFAIGPGSAAQGIGPKNLRVDRQHHAGIADAPVIDLDGRTLSISRCGTRIFETAFNPARGLEEPLDLTRYSRHLARAGLVALAQQRHPHNHVWGLLADGSLVCATYLPEEDVLGMARRAMAEGVAARSIASITDPAGRFDQLWIAAEYQGSWHVLRMAPWREDGESDENAVMLDMALVHDGDAQAQYAAPLFAGQRVQGVADGEMFEAEPTANGAFMLDRPATRAVIGLPYPAAIETLPINHGGDNGPARGKMARISRALLAVEQGRGLAFGEPGRLQPIEQLSDPVIAPGGPQPESDARIIERAGDWTRSPVLRVERHAPFEATVAAIGATIEVQQK